MRSNLGIAIGGIVLIVVSGFVGYALHGGNRADGNPVGPLHFAVPANPTTLPNVSGSDPPIIVGKPSIISYCNSNPTNCTAQLDIATTIDSSTPPSYKCPDGDACMKVNGIMESTDSMMTEHPNVSVTLSFHKAK